MSATTLNEVTDLVTDATHFNNIQEALSGDWVPRNASGEAEDRAGSLGLSTKRFIVAKIKCGYLLQGTLKFFYDYAGLLVIPQGWMLCNGDLVNETNYEAQAGRVAGDWNKYVGLRPFENLYLPSLNSKYLIGGTTTQSGQSAITFTGNAGHTINLEHNHTSPLSMGNDNGAGAVEGTLGSYPNGRRAEPYQANNSHAHSVTVANSLSTAQTIQPKSIKAKIYMRII
jgi:hypothetical protein